MVTVIGGTAVAMSVWLDRTQERDLGPTAVVLRGPMVISVTEGGEIEAGKRKVISNELKWPVIIEKVVPEGSIVAEGDDIVVFECKALLDAIVSARLSVTTSKSSHTQASENLKLKKKEMDNVVRKAEQGLVDAQEDLRRYEEGDWPIKKGEAESSIQIAEQDLTLAQGKLDFKLKVNQDKELKSPYSESEIKADQLSVARLKIALQKAVSERDMLLKYNHPRELRKLKTGVTDAELALERARVEAKTTLLVAEANALAKEQEYQMKMDTLNEHVADEKKLVTKADTAGLVVYDTAGSRWRPSNVTVEVGVELGPRQQIMIIPDMTTLQVETKVYESIIDQVGPGMRAYVHLDAKPGEPPMVGYVSEVSPLPDSQGRWISTGMKVFNVTVKFDEPPESLKLKPGLTTKVQLVLARLQDVLSVPIAAVYTEQDQTYVRRVAGGKAEAVSVKVGRMSDKRVEIVTGLSEGDRVLLVPPSGIMGGAKPKGPKTRPATRRRPSGGARSRPSGGARSRASGGARSRPGGPPERGKRPGDRRREGGRREGGSGRPRPS